MGAFIAIDQFAITKQKSSQIRRGCKPLFKKSLELAFPNKFGKQVRIGQNERFRGHGLALLGLIVQHDEMYDLQPDDDDHHG